MPVHLDMAPPADPSPPFLGHPLGFAAALLVLYPLDLLLLGRHSPETLALRLGWALAIVSQRWIFPRISPASHPHYVLLSCVGDQIFFTGLIALLGATSSPYFTFLFVFPVIHALSYPLYPRAVLWSGVTASLGYVALGLSADLPPLKLLLWVLLTGGATFFGIRASEQARRALDAEAQARMERERRELLEQLAMATYQRTQSEKMILLGRLAANVVHELNNPLAYVRSSVHFLQEDMLSRPPESSGERAEAFHDALHGLERIQEIVSDLRGFSRLEGNEPEQCTVEEAVQDASRIARLRLKHVAQLQVQLPEALPGVQASPRKLAQVLVNLLVNAADALEQVGTKNGEIRVRALQQEGQVVVLVEDNGPGFPPAALARLFEPFFTTKSPEKGTGLGLALSRGMVERFGGSLVAENRAEGGACLRLSLRAALPPSARGSLSSPKD